MEYRDVTLEDLGITKEQALVFFERTNNNFWWFLVTYDKVHTNFSIHYIKKSIKRLWKLYQ